MLFPDEEPLLPNPGDDNGTVLLEELMSLPRRDSASWYGKLWPQGKVKYCKPYNMPYRAERMLADAIRHVEEATCIRFTEVPVDSLQDNGCAEKPAVFISAKEPRMCWSYIGMSLQSEINIGEGCWTLGIIAHEIGHTIAMAHEQSRSDRDNYVYVNYDNIKSGVENNFHKETHAYNGDPYDFLSLMHYGPYDFAKDRSVKTITALVNDPNVYRMGQRNGFSRQDVAQINKMYNYCRADVPIVATYRTLHHCYYRNMHECGSKCCCNTGYNWDDFNSKCTKN
jgi:astacin